MELNLMRFADAKDYTYGILYEKGVPYPLNFVLEDERRLKKVRKETRIPADRYEIVFREVESELTMKYRKRFPGWFKWHLMLKNVLNFNYVYIHIGNTDEDTDACILVGNTCDLKPPTEDGFIGESVEAYKRFYLKLKIELNRKRRVFISIYEKIIDYE